MADRDHVDALTCSVCSRFKDKIHGMRNFSPAFIEGSRNLRASNFKDHTATDMHKQSMLLLKKEQLSDICQYAPIAKALHSMDAASQLTVKRKFDIAFVFAKEHIAFTKMKPLCEWGVLGAGI